MSRVVRYGATINPLLKRESIVAIGRAEPFLDRLRAVALTVTAVVSCLFVWDWKGWDRASIAGALSFARTEFVLVVAVQASLSMGFVLPITGMIASERDKKTLDALLATRLTGAQIVLGVMAAGLVRFANGLVATLPLAFLVIYLGGIDPRFVALACLGMTSTALGTAALAAVASVESRTVNHASKVAIGLLEAWYLLPGLILLLRPFILPAAPAWLVMPVLWALDSGPLGPAANYLGICPRPWGLAAGVLRMAAIQVVVAGTLTAWAVWRLRPASRAVYDVEGRIGRLRQMNRPLASRRPCGGDPVLWNEVYGLRLKSRTRRVLAQMVRLTWVGMLVVGTWWFAAPAFKELAERGYGPSANSMPEINPLMREIVERMIVPTGATAQPGQARLEFNLALRQFSAMAAMGFLISTFAAGVGSVKRERERDTWLGLLATPLSGRDIVRGKVLGAIWKGRDTLIAILGLWVVGLASGAVHPLGFIAVVAWLGVCGPFYGAIGVGSALRLKSPLNPAEWIRAFVAALVMLLMAVVPLVIVSASLFSYEEVQAVISSGAYLPFGRTTLGPWVGARAVAFGCLAGIATSVVWAAVFTRSLTHSFDALVGRPCRPELSEGVPTRSPQPIVTKSSRNS